MAAQPHPDAAKPPRKAVDALGATAKVERPRHRVRRWRNLLLLCLLSSAWFAPQIVAATALRQWLAPLLVPGYPANIEVRGAQLSWLAPVELYGILLHDLEGHPLVEIDVLRSETTFLRLMVAPGHGGALQFDRVRARVELQGGKSNLEETFRAMFSDPSFLPSMAQRTVTVTDGSIEIVGEHLKEQSRIDRISARLEGHDGSVTAMTLRAQGSIDDAGTFAVDLTGGRTAEDSATVFDAKLTLKKVAAGRLQPLLSRLWPRLRIEGTFDAALQGRWSINDNASKSAIDVGGRIDGANFIAELLAEPKTDRVAFKSLSAGGHVNYHDGVLHLDDLRLRCDVGNLAANGTLPLASMTAPSFNDALQFLERDTMQATAELDLARTARMFPSALGLRDDVELTSGIVRGTFESRKAAKEEAWTGSLEVSNLSATLEGRVQHWNAPLSMTLDAHRNATGTITHQLRGRSEFWTLSSGGTLQEGRIETSCDFDRFVNEVGRFVDLSGIDLAGKASVNVGWRRGTDESIQATGSVLLEELRVGIAGCLPWNEEHLKAEGALTVAAKQGAITRIETGSLSLTSGSDTLRATLIEPARGQDNKLQCQMECRLAGDVATWRARLAPGIALWGWDFSSWNLGGRIEADAHLVAAGDSIRVDRARANFTDLRAFGHGLFIADSPVRIDTAGEWDRAGRRWSSTRTAWVSNSLSASLEDLSIVCEKGRTPRADAVFTFRGGIRDLLKWTRDPASAAPDSLDGVIAGRATLHSTDQGLAAEWTSGVENISMTKILPEPNAFHNAGWSNRGGSRPGASEFLSGARSRDRFALERDGLPAPLVIADDHSSSGTAMSLGGAIRYEAQGNRFAIEKLEIALAPGDPRYSIKPKIDFARQRPLLILENSPLAQNANLSPTICRSWLKYAVPIVADAVEIEGNYSIDVEQARVPVLECNATEAAGTVSVPSAQLRAGGLAAQLAAAAMNVERILLRQGPYRPAAGECLPLRLANQRVAVRISGGRVYHRNLEFLIGNMRVRTEGSVGWDNSLSMIAVVPIHEEWIRANPRLIALRGQGVRISVTGTLARPHVDCRALGELASAQERQPR